MGVDLVCKIIDSLHCREGPIILYPIIRICLVGNLLKPNLRKIGQGGSILLWFPHKPKTGQMLFYLLCYLNPDGQTWPQRICLEPGSGALYLLFTFSCHISWTLLFTQYPEKKNFPKRWQELMTVRFSCKRKEVSYLKRANPFFLVFFSVSSTDSSVFFFPLLFFSFFFPLVFFFFPSSASRSWREELLAGVSWPELCSDRSSSGESEHRDGGRHWTQ